MTSDGAHQDLATSVLSWLAALTPAVMLMALLLRSVWDVDIFWQLKLGELILAHGGPIHREPFSALHLGEPLPTLSWLGQAIMAGVRELGGWRLLRLVDALCWLGGFWICAAACRVRGATWTACALALTLAFIAVLPTASIRPQSFAVLCFGTLLAIRRLGWSLPASVGFCAPLFVAWQNLHPSVSIAAIAMAAVAAPGWLDWLRSRKQAIPWTPTVLACLAFCAMFATPDGADLLQIAARNAEASMAIGASEWLPLWIEANHVNAIGVVVALIVGGWLVLKHPARIDVSEIAVVTVFLVMTLATYRFVLFFGVALIPVIARAASPQKADNQSWRLPRGAVVVPVLLTALFGPVLVPTRFAANIPLAAIERLKRENVSGTVYADFPFGGAIIDGGYPAWRVAYDGRYYRYSSDEWKYNGGIENGFVPLVDIERKWRPAAFILNENHNRPIADELAHSWRWRRIYDRQGIVAYVPRRRALPAPAHR